MNLLRALDVADMEVSRVSAALVRSWLGPCTSLYLPETRTPLPPLVLRPDRLGLGATPVAVSEESVKRKALGIKIGRKLKKKPPKADDDIQTAVEEDVEEEDESMSRSCAVRGKSLHPTLSVGQHGLGKRKRRSAAVPVAGGAACVGCPSSSPCDVPISATRSVRTTTSPPSGGSAVTSPQGGSGGLGDDPIVGSVADASLAHRRGPPPATSLSPDRGADHLTLAEPAGIEGAVEGPGTEVVQALATPPARRTRLNFSICIPRLPYSKLRLTRSGPRARHRRAISTK